MESRQHVQYRVGVPATIAMPEQDEETSAEMKRRRQHDEWQGYGAPLQDA
jgi:hypothetical protein